jgi:hypothetical protein
MSNGWGRPFDDPIEVGSRKLVTLRDARRGTFILLQKKPARTRVAPNKYQSETHVSPTLLGKRDLDEPTASWLASTDAASIRGFGRGVRTAI